MSGPLEAELIRRLRMQVQERGFVLWIDPEREYSAVVSRWIKAAAGEARGKGGNRGKRSAPEPLGVPIVQFEGSYLRLLPQIIAYDEGFVPPVGERNPKGPPLVVHLGGLNVGELRAGPLLERVLWREPVHLSLATILDGAAAGNLPVERLRGLATPESLAGGFVALEGALMVALQEVGIGGEGGLVARLWSKGPAGCLADLLACGEDKRRVPEALVASTVQDVTEAYGRVYAGWFGLPAPWWSSRAPAAQAGSTAWGWEELAFPAIAWALCVEFVHDAHRLPPHPELDVARGLPQAVVENCRTLARNLRARHVERYSRWADETEEQLGLAGLRIGAADLGEVDTFRFEEEVLFQDALRAIERLAEQGRMACGEVAEAAPWVALEVRARRRTSELQVEVARPNPGEEGVAGSFWVWRDAARRGAWELVGCMARLGRRLAEAGGRLSRGRLSSWEEGVERYVLAGAPVDRSQRELEKRRSVLLADRLGASDHAYREDLELRLRQMRGLYEDWADRWAHDWSALTETVGALPALGLQQRRIFEDRVRPWVLEGETVAYFVVDALRYEMGAVLAERLIEDGAAELAISARLAELPTVTEVGMNVLAPVERESRLEVELDPEGAKILGFRLSTFRVDRPESREKAMSDRVKGVGWFSLSQINNTSDERQLARRAGQHTLLVVHSTGIDEMGEASDHLGSLDAELGHIRAAIGRLRRAGVRRFLITADHGFLLIPGSVRGVQSGRLANTVQRRYALSGQRVVHKEELSVDFGELRTQVSGGGSRVLHLPRGIGLFDQRRLGSGFVHGGNSPAERVIPVVSLQYAEAAGESRQSLSLELSPSLREGGDELVGFEGLLQARGKNTLAFGGRPERELRLEVIGQERVAGPLRITVVHCTGGARQEEGLLFVTVGSGFSVVLQVWGPTAGLARLAGVVANKRVELEGWFPVRAEEPEVRTDPKRVDVGLAGGIEAKPAKELVGQLSGAPAIAPANEPTGVPPAPPAPAPVVGHGPSETAAVPPERAPAAPPVAGKGWLDAIGNDPAARTFFELLDRTGQVRENDAESIFGNGTRWRIFARTWEAKYKAILPFEMVIEGTVPRTYKKGRLR